MQLTLEQIKPLEWVTEHETTIAKVFTKDLWYELISYHYASGEIVHFVVFNGGWASEEFDTIEDAKNSCEQHRLNLLNQQLA